VLLGAWVDGAPEDLCIDEAIWPRVLTPIDGALASDADVVAPPVGKVRGNWTRGRGATDLPCGTLGEVERGRTRRKRAKNTVTPDLVLIPR
jgi:hypothetical protein